MGRRHAFHPAAPDALEGRLALSTITPAPAHPAAHVAPHKADTWSQIVDYVKGRVQSPTHHAKPKAPSLLRH